MIDKEILDAVLPLPTLDELKEQKVEELKDEGFVISNFHSGGVFYTMLMIVLRIKVEVMELLRVVLNNMFVSHAGGAWLDLKMADYSKKRKKAQKTQGFITVRRTDMTGEAVKIPKGHVFKSILDINGEELRFFVLEAATLQKGASSVDVLVEAETEGSRYNVPAGQIVRTLTTSATSHSATPRTGSCGKAATPRTTRARGHGHSARGRSWRSGRRRTPSLTRRSPSPAYCSHRPTATTRAGRARWTSS